MTKATIDDVDVAGRRVLLRVDFNVPLRGGRVVDDRRIRAALPTITALRERGARTLIVAHLGRPKGRADRALSVVPVADRLGARLDHKAWDVPPIFELIRKRGRIADDEMNGTFNMGLGMILVVDPADVPPGAEVVGEVVRHSGPDRVVIS